MEFLNGRVNISDANFIIETVYGCIFRPLCFAVTIMLIELGFWFCTNRVIIFRNLFCSCKFVGSVV